MSRNCWETGKKLITPHIEIELYEDYKLINSAGVNVSAFENALAYVLPASTYEKGPVIMSDPHCLIYGVVGRIVNNHEWAYLNIDEPSISKTLMGYITEEDFKNNLPKTFERLEKMIFLKRLEKMRLE